MCLGKITEANYIDSKPLERGYLKREKPYKVLNILRKKEKRARVISMDTNSIWFVEPVRFQLALGNASDNNEQLLKRMLEGFGSKVHRDKGYLTKHKAFFEARGCKIISKVRKNMKKITLTGEERYYLKKRGLIETVFDQMVNICQIEQYQASITKKISGKPIDRINCLYLFRYLAKIQEFQPKEAGLIWWYF